MEDEAHPLRPASLEGEASSSRDHPRPHQDGSRPEAPAGIVKGATPGTPRQGVLLMPRRRSRSRSPKSSSPQLSPPRARKVTFQEPVRNSTDPGKVDRNAAKTQKQTEGAWSPWWKKKKDWPEAAKQSKKGQYRGPSQPKEVERTLGEGESGRTIGRAQLLCGQALGE